MKRVFQIVCLMVMCSVFAAAQGPGKSPPPPPQMCTAYIYNGTVLVGWTSMPCAETCSWNLVPVPCQGARSPENTTCTPPTQYNPSGQCVLEGAVIVWPPWGH